MTSEVGAAEGEKMEIRGALQPLFYLQKPVTASKNNVKYYFWILHNFVFCNMGDIMKC